MAKKSTTRLATFFFYSEDEDDKETVVLPRDLSAVFPSMPFPKGGMTALYGFNNTSGVLNSAIQIADNLGVSIAKIEVIIDNNKWTSQNISFEATDVAPALGEINFLSLTRVRADVAKKVRQYWEEFYGSSDLPDTEEKPCRATARPDLVARLREKPEFSHLDAISYNVKTPLGFVGMATVFNPKVVISIKEAYSTLNAEYVLPPFE